MAHALEHVADVDCTCSRSARVVRKRRVPGKLRHLLGRIWRAYRTQRQLQALNELDDRLLADVGISREAAERELAKSSWS